MKVTCLIDSLGSGGAQRQLCTLAVLLKRRRWEVSVATYHPFDFFLPLLDKEGIPVTCLESPSVLRRIFRLRRWLRRESHDVVLAFLERPALYAELAALPWRRWGLVVSERSANPAMRAGRARWLRQFHRTADYVTTNSHSNRRMVEDLVPALRGRVVTIYNTVDLESFAPRPRPAATADGAIRFAAVSSYQELKNVGGFVRAFANACAARPAIDLRLDWYGSITVSGPAGSDRSVYDRACRAVAEHGLQDRIRLHPPRQRIDEVYAAADAVVLPSFYEGLSNVVCEAMASGRPVLTSDVSDARHLVEPGGNGFLFDPRIAEDMTAAVLRFCDAPPAEREAMGVRSRQMAERMFDPQRIAASYDAVLRAAARRQRVPLEHWIPETPAAAERTADVS